MSDLADPILITGGHGFIGSALARRLAGMGHRVHVVDPAPRPAGLPESVVSHTLSILDHDGLVPCMQGMGTVFHMAAVARLYARDPAIYDRVNRAGTEAVIAAARAAGVTRLVVTSTALVLWDWRRPAARISENSPQPPLAGMAGPYSRSKWRAEALVRAGMAQGLDAVLVYPTVPLGPPAGFVTEPTEMLRQFLTAPPPAYLETTLDFVDVDDVAEAHMLAAAHAPAGGRYLIAGEGIGFGDFLGHLHAISGRAMPRHRIPYGLAAATAHLGERWARLTGGPPPASVEGVRVARHAPVYDAARARSELGWSPRPVGETIRRAAEAVLADRDGGGATP